mgnify:CR=1 FL=1
MESRPKPSARRAKSPIISAVLNGDMKLEKVPIFIGDYVLSTYGTGAVMGVPAHDQRDFIFAKKLIFQLPVSIISIISNILLNIILIPRYGAIGAVVATAVSALIADSLLLYLKVF